MKLSERSKLLTASSTLAINAMAKERAATGLPVYNLSTGEPDCITPENIRRAACSAIEEGFTKYTAAGGVPELKQAIASKFKREFGLDFTSKQITCANGGKQILYNLFQVLLNEGDEVLCFSPYWLSYKTQVELAGGKLVEVDLDDGRDFAFDAETLAKAVTSRSVAIILNSPCNPTGQVMDHSTLRTIADLALKKNLLIISDDVYEYFYYSEEKPEHILSIAPELLSQTFVVNAVSKTYAMTGWRLGYAVGPQEVIQKMEELQSHSASNPSSISQMAAVEALTGPQESVAKMRANFIERKNLVMELLEGKKYITPQGAFYTMIKIEEQKLPDESDLDFCLALLKERGVAVVPGDSFGECAKGYVRISFACSLPTIRGGLEELKSFRIPMQRKIS